MKQSKQSKSKPGHLRRQNADAPNEISDGSGGLLPAADMPQLSPPALRDLQETVLRIKPPVCAVRLWERVLTSEERTRLGGDIEKAFRECGGTAGIWMKLRGVSFGRAVVEVARSLGLLTAQNERWLLRELGEIFDDSDEAVAAAVAAGSLVLTERPRRAWWNKRLIAIDWDRHSVLWNYFWELCQNAKAGQPVDRSTFGSNSHADFVVKQKSRLRQIPGFPDDLADLIKRSGRGTQKLELLPSQIRMFQLVTIERLEERTA